MKTQEVGFHSVGENDAASGTRERSVKGSAYTSVACGVRTGNGSPMSIALHPTRWADRSAVPAVRGQPWPTRSHPSRRSSARPSNPARWTPSPQRTTAVPLAISWSAEVWSAWPDDEVVDAAQALAAREPRLGPRDRIQTRQRLSCTFFSTVNARFAVMCAHYLYDPDFCSVPSGWDTGMTCGHRTASRGPGSGTPPARTRSTRAKLHVRDLQPLLLSCPRLPRSSPKPTRRARLVLVPHRRSTSSGL
jgi:hypothetical protein